MLPSNFTATFAHCNDIFSLRNFINSITAQALSNKGKRLFGLTAKHTVKKR
ncbi:hypothetical protein D5Q56_02035 [Vibrio parahaemolyticus]|nr:hypothetical protein [Vibrio parahaemolyticus]